MSDGKQRSGRCLCGGVTFTFHADTSHVGTCHCSKCLRWSAGPFLGVEGATDLKIENEAQLAVYKSSQWGERCFCKTCGSILFWRTQDGSVTVVSAGALDDDSGLTLTSQIFMDEKPDYYDFANDTEKLTGAEFMAKYMGGVAG